MRPKGINSPFPWKLVSDRISKGPAYALGMFIASLAVIATFFLPYGPTPVVYAIAILISLPLLVWYPITKKSHARLRAELEKAQVTNP